MDTDSSRMPGDWGTVLLIIAVAALSAATVVAFAGGVTAQFDTSERTISQQEVTPGETVEVTIEATLSSGGERVSIADDFSPAFEDSSVNTIEVNGAGLDDFPIFAGGDGTFIEAVFEQTLQAGDTVTVTYEVTVPQDVSDGTTFDFTGGSAIDDTSEVSHSGDSQLTAGEPDLTVTNYDVSPTEVGPGETVTVTADVTNNGGISGSKDVTLVTDGTNETTETVSLAAGASDTVQFTTSFAETGQYDVTVNDLSPTTVSVATSDVSVTDYDVTPTQAATGETITVTATVTNAGGESGSTDVTLVTDGTDEETQTVTVPGDSTETVEFTTSFAQAGQYDVTVNDLSPTTVSVGEANVSVTDFSVDKAEAAPDEQINVTAEVTNTGGLSGDIDVRLVTDGTDETTTTVTVPGGSTETVEFTTSFSQSGDHQIGVNDLAPTTVTVGTADVSVTDYSVSATEVEPGETLTVTATVTNAGEIGGETDVTLFTGEDATAPASEAVTTKTVSVAGGATETVEFNTSFAETGQYDVAVNDLAPTTITVAEIAVTDFSLDATEVEPGETLTATATVENGKSTTDSLDVQLTSNGEVQETQTVSVGAGNTTTVQLTTSFQELGDYDVAVNDLPATTVTVADIVVTDYSVNRTEAEPGEPFGIEATVENTKSTADSLDVVLSTDGTATETKTVSLDAGGTTTVSFDTSFQQFGDYDLSVNDLEPTTVTVGEANLSLVDVSTDKDEVLVGEDLTVTAAVANDGTITGTLDVTVFADGEEVASDSVTVGPGETGELDLTTSFDSVGTVQLSVNDGPAKEVTVFDFEDDDSSAATSTPTAAPTDTPTPTEAPTDTPTPTEADDEEPTPTEADDEEPTPTEADEETATEAPETEAQSPAGGEEQFGFGFVAALAALLAALALVARRRE